MGICRYCNKKAGFLKSAHSECKDLHSKGMATYRKLAHQSVIDNEEFSDKAKSLIDSHFLSKEDVFKMAMAGWFDAVADALDDHILSEEEEKNLLQGLRILPISREDIEDTDEWHQLIFCAVLRDLDNGLIPKRLGVVGELPFNFQKSEDLVWLFHGIPFSEERTRMTYVGGSQGVSIRIARGLYYRVGGFKGERIPVSEIQHIDTGLFAITTKHVYFSGDRKSFRIPYTKMIEIRAYEDGIRIQRDAMTAKPMIFALNNSWFAVNLINKLSSV